MQGFMNKTPLTQPAALEEGCIGSNESQETHTANIAYIIIVMFIPGQGKKNKQNRALQEEARACV
jgi:hypothetical protein